MDQRRVLVVVVVVMMMMEKRMTTHYLLAECERAMTQRLAGCANVAVAVRCRVVQ